MLYTITCTCIINCIDLPNILLPFSVSTRWGMNMMMMEKAVKGLHNFFSFSIMETKYCNDSLNIQFILLIYNVHATQCKM